jgi:hypothetical protein
MAMSLRATEPENIAFRLETLEPGQLGLQEYSRLYFCAETSLLKSQPNYVNSN